MNYNVKGTGVQITDEIRGYVEKRLTHVEKFVANDTTALIDVELELQSTKDGKTHRAEFTLSCGGRVYRTESRGETLHEAIDLATAELTQEVTRNKKKSQDLFRRGAGKIKDFIRGFGGRA